MDRVVAKKAFLRVYDTGSFTQAAGTLGLSVASVSKLITDLENRLSVKLLERSTRLVKPTSAGEVYASRLRTILDDLEQLELEVSETNKAVSGELYISVPMDYGKRVIAPLIGKFLLLHPDVKIRVDYNDSQVDLFKQPYDLAIRASELNDSGLIAKKIDKFGVMAAASPNYLSQNGVPQSPEDLHEHKTLSYTYSGNSWLFVEQNGQTMQINIRSNLIANNGEALVQSAISGAGILYQPDFMLTEGISRSQLVPLLENYCFREIGVYLVYLSKEYMAYRLRVFIDFIAENLEINK